jgi:hypothetical protein
MNMTTHVITEDTLYTSNCEGSVSISSWTTLYYIVAMVDLNQRFSMWEPWPRREKYAVLQWYLFNYNVYKLI